MKRQSIQLLAGAVFVAAAGITAIGSSHREAPGITKRPKVDGTDFYMFRSYEAGREGLRHPDRELHSAAGRLRRAELLHAGPERRLRDPRRQQRRRARRTSPSSSGSQTTSGTSPCRSAARIAVPLINIGRDRPRPQRHRHLNVLESYTLRIIRGDRRTGQRSVFINDATTRSTTFKKPVDRIGDKSIRANYAPVRRRPHLQRSAIPGCARAGLRRPAPRGFVVNLAEVFDLINLNPLGAGTAARTTLADKNVTTLALEVPIACLRVAANPSSVPGRRPASGECETGDRGRRRRGGSGHAWVSRS